MALPPRGTGLVSGLARPERGYGVPLTDEQRSIRHNKVGVKALPSNLTTWWNGLATWQKALVVLASLGGVAGGITVLARRQRSLTFFSFLLQFYSIDQTSQQLHIKLEYQEPLFSIVHQGYL